jgi:hypothetical protein
MRFPLWRLTSFWQPFWRFLVWGDSWQKRIIKMIILLAGIIGLPIFWKTPAYLYLYAFEIEFISRYVQIGTIAAVLIAFAWILISIGRAYELSGVPDLQVADELERDQDVFRLRLFSQEKDFKTTVWLHEVYNADGTKHLKGRFPVDLEWSHNPNKSNVHLVKGISSTVAVAEVRYSDTGMVGMLFYTGATNKLPLQVSKGQSLYFELLVERKPLTPIRRWFRFERTDDAEFRAFPNELPPFTPQAIPLTSKRDPSSLTP